MTTPDIQHFYHPDSGTLSYVVSDPATARAAVIDPVLDFCIVSGRTSEAPVDALLACIESGGLTVDWILETHAHADHLSGAQAVKRRAGGRIAIGEGIRDVQAHFGPVFNLKSPFSPDGSQFDHLFADGETFSIGEIEAQVLHTPGHTNDSVTYVMGKAAFVGDTVFMTDFGTARCDFPGGDAGRLYDSIQKLFALPGDTDFYLCHDYPPEDRELRYRTSLAEQQRENKHVGGRAARDEFVGMREARDETLALPRLIIPSIQVNIQAGRLPPAEDNEITYIKIPLDHL